MKKTLMMLLGGLLFALAGNAQVSNDDRTPFYQGKYYAGASLSGFDLRYNGCEKWNFDLTGKCGYLFTDNWMVTGQLEYDYRKHGSNTFKAGVGARYYIEQNGLFLGAGANYVHQYHCYDDFMPTIQLGYSFFLNRTMTIEPELYYNQSLKDHSDYSGFGFRIGFGIYFE